MSQADRAKWDARYADAGRRRGDDPPAFVRGVAAALPQEGRALDLACGEGQTLAFLAGRGLECVGVDVSAVGLAKARALVAERGLADQVRLVEHDLDAGLPPLEGRFDVVSVIHFHAPTLWPALRALLAPGGFLLLETLTTENADLGLPHPSARYLARPSELLAAATGLRVRLYRETLVDGSVRAQLLAQEPSGAPPDLRRR